MADARNASSNTPRCIPNIDDKIFDLGCLGPALAIILILAYLKRRQNIMLEYCNGHPGLVIPINFLGSFKNIIYCCNIWCYSKYMFGDVSGKRYWFVLFRWPCLGKGSEASIVFERAVHNGQYWVFKTHCNTVHDKYWYRSLIAVLVYGIIFYPFFACLSTDYKLVGSLVGFVYAALRFCFKLGIDFQCRSFYEGITRKILYLELLGYVPTYLCLLFIVIRFGVLLFFEIRQKWFHSPRSESRAGEGEDTCLIGKPGIEHVRMLLNPVFSLGVANVKWYTRLLYCIYQPRPDFKFSTQLISTLVVCGIILFQILVTVLAKFDPLREAYSQIRCSTDVCTPRLFEVFLGSIEGASIACSLISVLLLLHFMKCHRGHVLQLYRGQRTFYQDVFVSPAKLVGRSLRFSGYQIAYTLVGYSVLLSFLAIVCFLLGLIFKYAKQIFTRDVLNSLEDIGVALLPTAGMAIFLWTFQWFLAYFVFRDRGFPNIAITVDNRRLFSIMSYFFFFYNILLGVMSCLFRILKGMALGVIFLSRIDRTCLMQGFQTWDPAFVAYLGFVNVLVAHSHPVMLMFCQLLLNRNKSRGLEESMPRIQTSLRRSQKETGSAAETSGLLACVAPVTSFDAYICEPRLPRMSQKAVNRWHVAVMLLRNPSIIKYRRQGVVTPVVNLGSINSELVAAIAAI